MKVIFFNVYGSGHVNPSLGLVKELINQNCEVIYYSGTRAKQKILNTTAEYRNYGHENFSISEFYPNANNFLFQVSNASYFLADRLFPVIKEEKPDFIIVDVFSPWGIVIAEKLDIPFIVSSSSFVGAYTSLYKAMNPQEDEMLISTFEKLQSEFGFTADIDDLGFAKKSMFTVVYTSKKLQPKTDELDYGIFRYLGSQIGERPMSEDDVQFISSIDQYKNANKLIIYLSLGTVAKLQDNIDILDHVIQAYGNNESLIVVISGIDQEVALSKLTEYKEQNDNQYNNNNDNESLIPDNFIFSPFVHQIELLKRCDLFITHCGMNSMNEGLYFKTPLILMPLSSDQFFNAKQLENLNIGYKLNRNNLTSSDFVDAFNHFYNENNQLSEEINIKLSEYSDSLSINSDSLNNVVQDIISFVKSKQI
eukprot:TRINITY_DN8062_c0_g1_i1.p1 TRINITY_DN8062_c0_g1~~TRINITY_DN8062_c0_g1_i1.p1  ORF type:complete len:422 (+),score=95.60 TRINITY_DN8062_c0_g1_i1:142-1407(+)